MEPSDPYLRCQECGEPVRASQAVPWEVRPGVELFHCGECIAVLAPGLIRMQADRESTDRKLRETYGISLDDYERMYRDQQGRCAICRQRPTTERRLAVDHDHDTGEVRGLLCGSCNLALGCFKDETYRLSAAIRYLKKPPARKLLRPEVGPNGETQRLRGSALVEAQIEARRKARRLGRPKPQGDEVGWIAEGSSN